mmetsp:Transcript_11425/g.11824  ORF Transcript_11425/g.11824 Transcript_11425/m.11824 type:complete len:164 (+) Transcript_11425:68-559(+)
MGSNISSTINKQTTIIEKSIDEKVNRRMMIQREIQMSVNIAQSRDSLMWFGGLYTFYLCGISLALISRRNINKIAFVPGIIGGFSLLNIYDLAYGNKLNRIVKEAEYIMDNERWRLIPPENSPLFKMYDEESKLNHPFPETQAVSTYWPSFLPFSRSSIDSKK